MATTVDVWKFKHDLARHNKDLSQAVFVGVANSHQDLVDLSYGGYLGYSDPDTKAGLPRSRKTLWRRTLGKHGVEKIRR